MRTSAGADFQAQQMGATTGLATNGANFVALTANSTAPVATDTTLAGEVVTAGGGLIRRQGTYAHTTGTTTYTITVTFTGNGSDVYPFIPAKVGVFTLVAAGVMMFESLVTAPPTLAASGDAFTVTETINI